MTVAAASTADTGSGHFASPVASATDTVWVETRYEYDPVSLLPNVVLEETSDGLMRRTETTYAHEVYGAMGPAGTHQLSEVYETVVRDAAANALACSRTLFNDGPGSGRVPSYVSEGCGDERETVVHFQSYDAFGRPATIWQAPGLLGLITYAGRHVASIKHAFDVYYGQFSHQVELEKSFGYDGLGRLIRETDENGTSLHYTYDGLGRLTHVVRTYVGEDQSEVTEPLAEHEYYLSVLANGSYQADLPNYVRMRLFAGGGTDETTAYFDGLGREIQTQQLLDPLGELVAVTFPEYDALGRPHRHWRPVEMAATPGNHRFIPILDVRTAAEDFYEDAAGNSPSANRPFAETTYLPDPLDRVADEQAPGSSTTAGGSGSVVAYRYGVAAPHLGAHNLAYTEVRDEDGRWTRTYSDALGRERFVARGRGNDAGAGNEEAITELVYDAADRLVEVRPPNYFAELYTGHPGWQADERWVTTYRYNSRGHVIEKTTPDTRNAEGDGPGTHRYAYDAAGRLRYSQDPEQRARGEVAYTLYDALGRVRTTGVGHPIVCDADENGADAPETCWDQLEPDGPQIADAKNPTCDPDGPPCRWEHQARNWRTLYHYDDPTHGNDRTTGWPFWGDPGFTHSNPLGRPVAVAYRTDGLWQSGQTPRWQATFFAYDAAGNVAERLVRTQDAAHDWEAFTYDFDRQGRLLADSVAVGPFGLRHDYTYDRRGLITQVRATTAGSSPGQPDLVLEYAVDGAVASRQLGSGAATVPYTYDVAGRLVAIGDVAQSGQPFAAHYHYSKGGLIAVMEARSETAAQACAYGAVACAPRWRYEFSYDDLARLTGAAYAGFVGQTYQPHAAFSLQGIAYDRQGNITALERWMPVTDDPDAQVIDQLTYTYEAGTNRLESVADAANANLSWDANPTAFVYDRAGNVIEMTETLSAGQRKTEVLRLDERHLPERLRISQGGEVILVDYRYDVEGQRIWKHTRTKFKVEAGGEPPPDPHYALERYVRDGMRLAGVFDGDGNLLWWNLGGAAGLVGRLDPETQTVFDEQLAIDIAEEEINDHAYHNLWQALLDSGLDPADVETLIIYAHPNVRSIALDAVPEAVAAAESSLTKDPAGSTHYQLTIGPTTDALYDAFANLGHHPDVADRHAEPAASSAASANAALVGAAIAAAYVEVETGEFDRRYYIADHLGSIRAVVNEQGDVIEARDHYPYGLMMPGRVFVQGQETREGYTGHELDAETGLYYAGARYYMPALARWTAVDPLAEQFHAWSPYNYVMGNPLSLVDPDGMAATDPPSSVYRYRDNDIHTVTTTSSSTSTQFDGDTKIVTIELTVSSTVIKKNNDGSTTIGETTQRSTTAITVYALDKEVNDPVTGETYVVPGERMSSNTTRGNNLDSDMHNDHHQRSVARANQGPRGRGGIIDTNRGESLTQQGNWGDHVAIGGGAAAILGRSIPLLLRTSTVTAIIGATEALDRRYGNHINRPKAINP